MAQKGTYRCRAIVLDKTKLGEKDLILTLLAESGRQIRAVAKGARRPGSRLAARCELCCEVDLLLARGKSLDIVSQAELLGAPLGPQPDCDLFCAGSAICEVAKLCSYEESDDPFVFAITRSALNALPGLDGPHLELLCAAYVFKTLSHLGYRPELGGCVLCGDGQPTHFSAASGGLVCGACAGTVAGAEPLAADEAAWLRALMALRFSDLSQTAVHPDTAALLLGRAHGWAATHLETRLRSLEFMLDR